MGRQEQRLAAGAGVGSDKAVADGTEMLALLRRQVDEADRLSGVDQRVLAHQVLDLRLARVVQSVVGGAHVGKLGIASARRDRAP